MRYVQAVVAMLVILAGGCLWGCGLTDSHVKQMDILNGLAVQAQQSLQSGAMTSVHASGQAINPGVRVRAAIVYEAAATYEGLAGQFSIAQQGESGADIDPAMKDTIGTIYRDKSIRSGETRTAVIDAAGKVVGYWTATRPAP